MLVKDSNAALLVGVRRGAASMRARTVHQASNTLSTDIWSTRTDSGGPPTATTGEPEWLRGSQYRGDSAPYITTKGNPNAAAACAGPVSTEIML